MNGLRLYHMSARQEESTGWELGLILTQILQVEYY